MKPSKILIAALAGTLMLGTLDAAAAKRKPERVYRATPTPFSGAGSLRWTGAATRSS